jgi:hypothetical protein
MFSCEHAAELLVLRVFLITPTWVAVKGEERVLRVVDRKMVFLKVSDDVSPTEITGDPDVDGYIDDFIDGCGGVRMSLENFLDDCFPHGPCLSSISYNVSPLISHII